MRLSKKWRRISILSAATWLVIGCGMAMDDMPGVVNVAEQPTADETQGGNQGAFPYYYNSGMPTEDDLVQVDYPSDSGLADLPPPFHDTSEVNQSAFPDYYNSALLLQSKSALEAEINRSRAALNLIKSYCESGEAQKAQDIYFTMPGFSDNSLINDYRAEAAGQLIYSLGKGDHLADARVIYNDLPKDIPSDEAMLAKARSIINLTTFYVRGEAYTDAYAVLMDIADSPGREELSEEIFKLMARMIPYLDNADETDKAYAVYQLLLDQVRNPETARYFADNFPAIPRYFLLYVKKTSSSERRQKRLDFLQSVFDSLEPLADSPDIALRRMNLAGDLVDYYTEIGQPDLARKYYEFMQSADKTVLLNN